MSKNNRWLQILTILLSLFSLSELCCLPPAAEAQTTGSITGTVHNDSTPPSPVAGIWVYVYNAATGKYIKGSPTISDGHYEISGLSPCDSCYKVRYYAQGTTYFSEYYDNRLDISSADPVSVADGSATNLDVVLSSGGSISGIVTDSSSPPKPIQNVYVYVYDSNGVFVTRSMTDNNGGYTATGLATGDYTLSFSGGSTGYISEWYDNTDNANADAVHVEAPNKTDNINAVLALGGSISGKVTISETSAPLVGAWINVYDSNNLLKKSAITGTDGSYTISGLSSGDYKVQFFEKNVNNTASGISKWYNGKTDAAGADSVSVGRTDVDASFNGASISGTVTKAGGGGIQGVTVEAYDSSGKKVASSNQTGTAGAYNIGGLLRGNYKLYFKAIGTDYVSVWYNNAASMSAANPVGITSLADAPVRNVELAAGGSISGTVQIQRNPDSSPIPVDGGFVQVFDSTDSSILKGAATIDDGTYEVTGLPTSGTFKVRFFSSAAADGSAGYGTSEWYDDQYSFDQATPVSIGSPATVDAVLEPSNLIPAYKLLLLKPRY